VFLLVSVPKAVFQRFSVSLLIQAPARFCRPSRSILLVIVFGFSLYGCGKPSPKAADKESAGSTSNAGEECRRKLNSAMQRIVPEAMATQPRHESIVNSLNSWLTSCAENEVKTLKISDANAAMLTPSVLRTASAIRFTENDILYIRDCLVLKSLTEAIWKNADSANASGVASDRERVTALFRHLVRNISLLPSGEDRVPVGLYEVLLTGRGNLDDRIWAFAESLRQRQLDAVVLQATTPGDLASQDVSKAADLLIGVIVEDELLLFDPRRGVALPRSQDASPIVTDPAGLDAISGDDRWKTASAWVVCHPSAFSPRMLILQERLEATSAAVLYEELVGGTSQIKPLMERLSEVIGTVVPTASIKIWNVPEQRIASAASLSEAQQQALATLLRPFDGPFERESLNIQNLITDPSVNQEELTLEQRMQMKLAALEKLLERSDDLFGKASRRLLMARLEQIMGNFDVGMIQDLQQIRIACLQEKIELLVPVDEKKAMSVPFKLPKTILDVQQSAVGDTLYWTSMAQMSRNDMGAAVATLRNYRRQYPAEKSVFPSLLNEAEALIQLGDLNSAAAVLTEANVEANPEQLRAQWLLSRLRPADKG
jgi:hypothetical protein